MVSTVLARHSLKTRITLTTLAIFVIGVWSLAFYADRVLRKDMQSLMSAQQFSTVSYIAADINDDLGERVKALEVVAVKIGPSSMGNTAVLQAFLEDQPILLSLFNGGVIALRLDGTAIAEFPLSDGRVGVNYMEFDHVAAALRKGKATIGRPVMGKKLRVPVFSMAVPIRDPQGKVIGALAGVINLGKPNFLDRVARNLYGKTGGYLLIASQYRMVVTATDKSRIMETLPAPGINSFIDRHIQGYEGSDIFINPRGVEILGSAKGIPVAGWYLAAQLPTEEAFAPIRDMQQRMLLATILLTLLAGSLTWWMLGRQLSPMLAAAKAMATISDTGQPPQPLPITTPDEIGSLIGGFNRLLETLAQREQALSKSESRSRAIIDASPVPLAMRNANGNVTYLNNAFVQATGYTLSDIPTLAEWRPLAYPDQQYRQWVIDNWRWNLEKAECTSTTFAPMEINVRCKDGAVRTFLSSAASVENESAGDYLVILYDITERKQAEERFRQTSEDLRQLNETLEVRIRARTDQLQDANDMLVVSSIELKRSNAELEQFAYVASHDLQEPMRTVVGFVQLLEMRLAGKLDPEALEFMGHVVKGALHMRTMIQGILTYSRVGTQGTPQEEVDSAHAVQEALALLGSQVSNAGAEVEALNLPTVVADRTQLVQLFQNLIGNAIKFHKGDTPRVRVEARRNGTQWRFTITDNGIGIAAEYRERIFVIFQRLHTHYEYDGTGLGLAICKRIVERHGGEIGVDSVPGGGSAFWFTLHAGKGT